MSAPIAQGYKLTNSSMATVVIKAQKRIMPIVSILVRPYSTRLVCSSDGQRGCAIPTTGYLYTLALPAIREVVNITKDETRSI
jgi:hypothetical protein